MEFAEYSIEEYLKKEDIPNKLKNSDVFIQMLEAVKAVHEAGYTH